MKNWNHAIEFVVFFLVCCIVFSWLVLPSKDYSLYKAVSHDDVKKVGELIHLGANANFAIGHDRTTLLMLAASKGDIKIVNILLQAGAEKSAKDVYSQIAYDYARRSGKTNLLSILAP